MDYQKFNETQAMHLLKQGFTLENEHSELIDADDIPTWLFGTFTFPKDKKQPEYTLNDMSDEYHSFGQLYEQRLVLSAIAFNAHADKAWKSYKHDDGELCFGGGWFIVGITTPEGDYAYHYPNEEWDKFNVPVLETAPAWDGHTADDVNRLLSL